MLKTKVFVVKDRATSFPIMVTKLQGETEREQEILSLSGYRNSPYRYLFTDLVSKYSTMDIYDAKVRNSRTHYYAYNYIYSHFNELKSGSVIDVEKVEKEG